MKGAAEQIFQRCGTYVKGDQVLPIDQAKVDHFVKVQKTFARAGERVIGFAMKYLDEDSAYTCAQTDEDTPDTMEVNGVPLDSGGEPIKPDKPGYYAIGSQQFLDWGGPDNATNCMDKHPPPATPAFDALTFVGLISLIDPPREAVPPSVLNCRRAGVKVVMVTGDHPETAAAIARMVNIIQPTAKTIQQYAEENGYGADLAGAQRQAEAEFAKLDANLDVNAHMRYTKSVVEAKVIPGHELKNMTADDVKTAFMYRDLVFARTSPEQKLKIVNAAQSMGHVVAVTGDGVNDSPALRGADIGCAMGIAGTDVSKEAADMILMTDDFSAIVDGIEEGRLIFDNLKKSIAYTLSSNIPEISPFLMFICTAMPLSLSTVLILCVDLGTDMIPAISLAYEKAESDIMERPPRDQDIDHLVTVKLVSFAYLQIGVFQALGGFYSFFVVMNDYGFKMRTLFQNADALGGSSGVPFVKDVNEISTKCPCGGGQNYDTFIKDIDFTVSSLGMVACTGSKCNGAGSNDFYAEIQTVVYYDEYTTYQRGFDTSTEAYTKLSEQADKKGKTLSDMCDLTNDNKFGVAWTKNDDWYPLEDKKTKWSPNNWPYGWGCPYGALRPTQYCKYPDITFVGPNPCYKGIEALRHAQTAAFVSIVIVQWADLIICKTRFLSIYHQGMQNTVMLFGLCSETLLCCALCYIPGLHQGLFTRDLIFWHWCPSMPFSILIFLYDETRKYLIRSHKQAYKGTPNEEGWLERYTYY
jgi:sodium/potassium-transporting ATPase subunit alpha